MSSTSDSKQPLAKVRTDGGHIICPGHSRTVVDLEFSKDFGEGPLLISACIDSKPMIREGSNGDWIGTFLGHKGAVWSARLNPTATQAATGAADFTARLWNVATGDELQSFKHSHIVKSAMFSKDGKQLYTAGFEKKIRLFDLAKPDTPFDTFTGHTSAITHLVVPDEHLIVSAGGDDKSFRIWDKRTKEATKTLTVDAPIASMELSAGGEGSLITAAAGNNVYFLNATTLEVLQKHTVDKELYCASYHPKARFFVTGTPADPMLRLYDYATGKEISCQKAHSGPVRCLGFNPTGETYASGSEDGTIRIWDWQVTEDGAEDPKSGAKSPVNA